MEKVGEDEEDVEDDDGAWKAAWELAVVGRVRLGMNSLPRPTLFPRL
jgi:hypothetical protein